jgi:hypothetical protein
VRQVIVARLQHWARVYELPALTTEDKGNKAESISGHPGSQARKTGASSGAPPMSEQPEGAARTHWALAERRRELERMAAHCAQCRSGD